MNSPLSPVIANLFMERFEKDVLDSSPLKPTVWLRYVDDTFVIWPHGEKNLKIFLNHINEAHPSIKFTYEMEHEGTLPFLDVLVSKKADGSL